MGYILHEFMYKMSRKSIRQFSKLFQLGPEWWENLHYPAKLVEKREFFRIIFYQSHLSELCQTVWMEINVINILLMSYDLVTASSYVSILLKNSKTTIHLLRWKRSSRNALCVLREGTDRRPLGLHIVQIEAVNPGVGLCRDNLECAVASRAPEREGQSESVNANLSKHASS